MSCANVSKELKAVGMKVNELAEADAKGMMLSVDELDLLTQLKEVELLSESNQYYDTNVPLTAAQVSELNNLGLKYGSNTVRVLGGRVKNGNVQATVNVNGKTYYNRDLNKMSTERGSVSDVMKYASTPRGERKGTYNELLKDARISSLKDATDVLDKLRELDGVSKDSKEFKRHMDAVKYIVGATVRAIPELAVYVDESARVTEGEVELEGAKKGIYIDINKNSPTFGNEQSATEVYVHELVHAASAFAMTVLRDKTSHIRTRLVKLHNEAMKVLTVEDFMPEVSIDPMTERKVAEARWKYVNESLEEFLAYAIANDKINEKLKDVVVYADKKPEKLLDRVVYYAKKLIDTAVLRWRNEDRSTTGDVAAKNILLALVRAQEKANTKTESSVVDRVSNMIDNAENYLADKKEEWAAKQLNKFLREGSIKGKQGWEKARWIAKALVAAVSTHEGHGAIEQLLSAFGAKPEGTLQMLIASMRKNDEFADVVEQLVLKSVQIDADRENTAADMTSVASNLFKKKLKREDKAMLQVVMQTNDGALLWSKGDAREMYLDKAARDAKISALESDLKSMSTVEDMRWYKFQIDGLVKYMTAGEGNEVQLKNAEAIARRLGTKTAVQEADVKVKELVDELVSLKAIEKLDAKVVERLTKLSETEAEALTAFAKLQKSTEVELASRLKQTDALNRRKGYVRETYDDYVTSTVAPIRDKKAMEDKGYKLEKTLPTSRYDLNGTEMGLYVSRDMIRQPYNKSAVRFVGDKQQGRTFFENALKAGDTRAWETAKKSIKEAKNTASLINEAIRNGKNVQLENVVMPTFDANGMITEYHYVTTNEVKNLIGLELDGTQAIGRSWAHALDEERSIGLNAVIWEEMLLDMAKNKGLGNISKMGREYIAIKLTTDSSIVKDIMNVLPKEYRQALTMMKKATVGDDGLVEVGVAKTIAGSAWDKMNDIEKTKFRAQLASGELAVRRDLLIPIFGMRDLSAANAPGIEKLPVAVKTFIRRLENFWKEIVNMYKVDVIIKMLPVMIGNIVGNIAQVVMYGANPVTVVDDMTKAWKELSIYRDSMRKINELNAKYLMSGDKSVKDEIKRLEMYIDSLAIKPLLDAGLYSQIMEDIDPDNIKSTNKIASWIDEKVEKLPEPVKVGLNWAYVTRKTPMFQAVQLITARSDFMSRYAQYRIALEKLGKRSEEKLGRKLTDAEMKKLEYHVALEVRDAFINYSNPDSPLLQYINDMGLSLFTKYALRIQRIGTELMSGKPIRAGAALFGLEALHDVMGVDIDTIMDKNVFLGDKSLLFMPGPMKIIEDIVTPQILTDVLELRKVL